MKRIAFFVLALILLASPVLAASSMTATISKASPWLYVMTVTWTAHTDGSFTSTATPYFDGMVVMAETNPGSTAPTANYDITLTSSDGVDVFGGSLANRHTSTSERAMPLQNGNYTAVPVAGALTVGITGNSQSGATGTIKIYYVK